MRMYNRVLSQTEVQSLLCRDRPSLDCVGVLALFDFEGSASDVSGAGWFGHVVRASQTDEVFTDTGVSVDGSRALRLLGQSAYVQLQPRMFGGAMSLCADVYYNSFTSWSRLVDFANGAANGVSCLDFAECLLGKEGGWWRSWTRQSAVKRQGASAHVLFCPSSLLTLCTFLAFKCDAQNFIIGTNGATQDLAV